VVAWRRASLRSLASQLAWPAGVALATGVLLILGGAGSSPAGLIGYTLAAFVMTTIVLEFVRGTRARKGLGSGGWWAALSGLVARNRRRYGGYIVHAAIVLLLIGAVGIGGFSTTREGRLAPGESLAVGDYRLVYAGSDEQRGANAQEVRARLGVYRGDDQVGTMAAGKNSYFAEEQTSNEVGIRTDWLRGEDLFVIADQFNEDGSVYLKVIVNPLVNFIWLSGLVFVFGSVVAMWPDAREQRRLAARFDEGAAVARA
jgi:cytochrome c-type biogenesis protein CcmF